MDLSSYPKSAVLAVINCFYNGKLRFKKSDSTSVWKLLQHFKYDVFIDLYNSVDIDDIKKKRDTHLDF